VGDDLILACTCRALVAHSDAPRVFTRGLSVCAEHLSMGEVVSGASTSAPHSDRRRLPGKCERKWTPSSAGRSGGSHVDWQPCGLAAFLDSSSLAQEIGSLACRVLADHPLGFCGTACTRWLVRSSWGKTFIRCRVSGSWGKPHTATCEAEASTWSASWHVQLGSFGQGCNRLRVCFVCRLISQSVGSSFRTSQTPSNR